MLQRIHDMALHAEQAELEHGEQPARSGADDDTFRFDGFGRGDGVGHGNSSVILAARLPPGREL
jgi:hypothetical protein